MTAFHTSSFWPWQTRGGSEFRLSGSPQRTALQQTQTGQMCRKYSIPFVAGSMMRKYPCHPHFLIYACSPPNRGVRSSAASGYEIAICPIIIFRLLVLYIRNADRIPRFYRSRFAVDNSPLYLFHRRDMQHNLIWFATEVCIYINSQRLHVFG